MLKIVIHNSQCIAFTKTLTILSKSTRRHCPKYRPQHEKLSLPFQQNNHNSSLLTSHFSLISPPRGAKKHLTNAKGLEFFKSFFELFHNDTSTRTTNQLFHSHFSTKSIILLHFQQTNHNLSLLAHHLSLIPLPRGAKNTVFCCNYSCSQRKSKQQKVCNIFCHKPTMRNTGNTQSSLSRHKKNAPVVRFRCKLFNWTNVFCTWLSAFFIRLNVERNLLAVLQRFETFNLNIGKMHKNIFSPIWVNNKSVALACAKPFHCTCHLQYLHVFLK